MSPEQRDFDRFRASEQERSKREAKQRGVLRSRVTHKEYKERWLSSKRKLQLSHPQLRIKVKQETQHTPPRRRGTRLK